MESTKTLLCALALFSLSGCSDDEAFTSEGFQADDSYIAVAPVPEKLQSGMPAEKEKEMLSVADPTPPEVWLLSLYQKRPSHDPERDVFYYQKLLDQILLHVHEDKRVVTNRLVQVTRQLEDKQIEADQEQLLIDFAEYLSAVEDQYVFGELTANYSNLRQQNISHDVAMQKLFELI